MPSYPSYWKPSQKEQIIVEGKTNAYEKAKQTRAGCEHFLKPCNAAIGCEMHF